MPIVCRPIKAFGNIIDDTFSNVGKYNRFAHLTGEKLNIVNDEEAIIHEGNYKVDNIQKLTYGKAFLL